VALKLKLATAKIARKDRAEQNGDIPRLSFYSAVKLVATFRGSGFVDSVQIGNLVGQTSPQLGTSSK
jgi:hypothetical protein